MFIYPLKNSYLQLTCAVPPNVVNKAIDQAMLRVPCGSEEPPPQLEGTAQLLDTMQASQYCPHVDITRSCLGFGRLGLRILNRDLLSTDPLVQLQALHSVLDQVQISENAIFLINLQVVYRLIDLMKHPNSIVREKVCIIFSHLASYYQARNHIMSRPLIIKNILRLITMDVQKVKYAAAYTLKTLVTDRFMRAFVLKNDTVIENLLSMVKNDHTEIVILHLQTLEKLVACDAERAIKSNCFAIMTKMIQLRDTRIIVAAMNVLSQTCKHEVGRHLSNIHDLTRKLRKYLYDQYPLEVIISTLGVLVYTTLTHPIQWRAIGLCNELSKRLITLCYSPYRPQIQLRCIQVLINMCACPDVKIYLRENWLLQIKAIRIKTPHQWNGASNTSSPGLDTGHNYRTMFMEEVEKIKDDDDHTEALNVHNYLGRLVEMKCNLINIINQP